MALPFRWRLTMTIGALVSLSVAAMAVTFAAILFYDMYSQYESRGRALHILTNTNISYGVELPEQVSTFVNQHMTVQALLLAELVELAEQDGAASPEEISDSLRKVLERSVNEDGVSIVDEFIVTNELGEAYIDTEDRALDFRDAPEESELSTLLDLLEPHAAPVVQDIRTQDRSALERKHVGVSGAGASRIVRVGASGDLIQEFTASFEIERFLERFMLPEDFNRMAVISKDGDVLGAINAAGESGADLIEGDVVQRAQRYLRTETDSPEYFSDDGSSLGVMSPLTVGDDQNSYVLMIEHRLEDSIQYTVNRAKGILFIGLGLILGGTFIGYFFSRGLSKPIVTLSKGAHEFGKGNLNYRMYLKRKDEFQGLAQAFNTMAISLQEYMHELEQESARRERLESEVRIASEMQEALLPEAPPEAEGLELVGWSKPSKEVGGDYYDFFELPDGRILVALGDATGKGVSAALLVTQCSGILRTLANELHPPGELLRRTNNAFHDRVGQTHRFVTLFVMIIDPKTGMVQFASAGHPSPMLINKGSTKCRSLFEAASGYPLGILKDAEFPEDSFQLEAGDTLVVFSDGLTDAQGPDNELYGEERIEALLLQLTSASLAEILARLREGAEGHMEGKEQTDDMTLVGMRYEG